MMQHWFCDWCRQVTVSEEPMCATAHCQGEDDDLELLTPEVVERRLAQLKMFRRQTLERSNPKKARCPRCSGVAHIEQKFRTSGGVREAGKGQLAGQPKNLTGKVMGVQACSCMDD